jgi:hypothetical protein
MGNRIEIKAKRGWLFFYWLFVSLLFASSFWFNDTLGRSDSMTGPPAARFVEGVAQILIVLGIPPGVIFGATAILLTILNYKSLKVFIGDYKLVIDDNGIINLNKGLIPWEDIEDIKIVTDERQKKAVDLVVFVHEPEKYIEKINYWGFMVHHSAQTMFRLFGTPIYIPTHFLKPKPEELLTILQNEFNKRKDKTGTLTPNTDLETIPSSAATQTLSPSSNPQIIASGQTIKGVISRQNRRHIFQIELTEPCELSVCVTNDGGEGLPNWESYVNVIDANGSEISASGRFEFPYNSTMEIENAGTYDIEIKSSRTGAYCLTVQC